MGEIAEGIINGFWCEICGMMVDGDEPGFPRTCDSCAGVEEEDDNDD